MALVIATGLLLGNADSYISVAEADEYHFGLQNDEWLAVDVSRKEALLKRVSIMIDARYRNRWQLIDTFTTVPKALKIATAEAALYSVSQDLLSVQSQSVKSVSIGSLAVSFNNSSSTKETFGAPSSIWEFLDMLLSGVASQSTGWGLISVIRV